MPARLEPFRLNHQPSLTLAPSHLCLVLHSPASGGQRTLSLTSCVSPVRARLNTAQRKQPPTHFRQVDNLEIALP